MRNRYILLLLLTTVFYQQSYAWIYPEHRDIAICAIQKLDSPRRNTLDRLWALARKGYESRLNEAVTDPSQGMDLKYLDYAAWPAIAGDHSTSSENLVFNILHTDWILNVAKVAAFLKNGLDSSKSFSEREAKLRDSDLRFIRVDPEYVSRAGSNNVHFMLARPEVKTSARSYFTSCFEEGSDLNLVGTYMWYHASAMYKARRLAAEEMTAEQRSALALSTLADEAFALHFLEDGFASGHVAGIWGNSALRKGTHDYYDERGLEVTTWNGVKLVITGDAYMRPQDCENAANTIMLSLEQLLDAASPQGKLSAFNDQPGVFTPDTFNIAKAMKMPARSLDPAFNDLFAAVLVTTPVPGLATGLGEIPRFRSELGPFVGLSPAARVSGIFGGFTPDQKTSGVIPRLEMAIHLGLGMDGVMNQSGDGLVFLDLGWRLDGASTIKMQHDKAYNQFGSILSAIPSREAWYFRLRLPFYLIPGDLIILGPVMLLLAPKKLNTVVATAGSGGLIPWQSGLITRIGRFQFILGREVGIAFYGTLQGPDALLVPDERSATGQWSLISMKSTQIDFPVLEYRPFRTFSLRQSGSLVVQLNAGVDIPRKVTMIEPANLEPIKLHPIWMVGLRVGFDWRYYYAKKRVKA